MNTETEKVVSHSVRRYTLAGWLAILQAVIIVPRVGVDFFVKNMTLSGYDIFRLFIGFNAVGDLLGIYVLVMFRRLLNDRHSFHRVDKLINALILCYAAFALIWTLDIIFNPPFDTLNALPIISAVSSLISIIYAIRLLKLDDNLSGLLKPYVYSAIAASILGATLVLGEYGRPLYMVSLILLSMILIRADSDPEYL